jgi:hypothetical protein
MLTRHALALSTTGELYGWGSNEHFRLGQPVEVKSFNKPSPIDFFNNKQKFTIRDIASGDDHSLIYVDQDYRLGFTQDLIYQIGYNKEESNTLHRGLAKEEIDKIAPASNGIVEIDSRLKFVKIINMAAGHKTSFFWTGEERILSGRNGEEISFQKIPGATWADFNIYNSFGTVCPKMGYLHFFRDTKAQSREMLLQRRTYEFQPELNESLVRVTISENGAWDA